MRATAKYFWTAGGLLLLQAVLGGAAIYDGSGEPAGGARLLDVLPHGLLHTWQTQLVVFSTAIALLAVSFYLAAALTHHEPARQRLFVDVLYGCLLVMVAGSMAGAWLSAYQRLGFDITFGSGHRGLEYVAHRHLWRVLLVACLATWLVLVCRTLRQRATGAYVMALLLLGAVAGHLLLGIGLM